MCHDFGGYKQSFLFHGDAPFVNMMKRANILFQAQRHHKFFAHPFWLSTHPTGRALIQPTKRRSERCA
ncbi:MAG: hypothetical protein ACI901_000930, partial [Octadecabacter sp.]